MKKMNIFIIIKSKIMKNYLLVLLALIAIMGCEKNQLNEEIATEEQKTEITAKEEINEKKINPEALTYYENIATMAEWYAQHPEVRNKKLVQRDGNETEENVLLEKLLAIDVIDSTNTEVSLFDLDSKKLGTFLETFVVIEANELSEKLKIDTTNTMVDEIKVTNEVFSQATNTSRIARGTASRLQSIKSMSARMGNEDPYWKVRNLMDKKEQEAKKLSQTYAKNNSLTSRTVVDSDSNFWVSVIANGILGASFVHYSPNTLSSPIFVNRIAGSFRKGRLLIALPGGFNTWMPAIVYIKSDTEIYDVGHVAIMSKNTWELPLIGDKSSVTYGAGEFGVKDEEIRKAWSYKHGVAFVGQVYDVKWRFYTCGWFCCGFRREARDVNNDNLYAHALNYRDRPYCAWYQVLFSKWAAPDRFICSSLAWYAAKQSADVNIGDWWKPTILPAGVYLSDRVRIIDNTMW